MNILDDLKGITQTVVKSRNCSELF